MMGSPLDYHSYTFGDNYAIIQQSNIHESKLMKHWNALAFHHVLEAVASRFLQLFHIYQKLSRATYEISWLQ